MMESSTPPPQGAPENSHNTAGINDTLRSSPWDTLPAEMRQLILTYLPMHEWPLAARVCHLWRGDIEFLIATTQQLVLDDGWYNIEQRDLQQLVQWCQRKQLPERESPSPTHHILAQRPFEHVEICWTEASETLSDAETAGNETDDPKLTPAGDELETIGRMLGDHADLTALLLTDMPANENWTYPIFDWIAPQSLTSLTLEFAQHEDWEVWELEGWFDLNAWLYSAAKFPNLVHLKVSRFLSLYEDDAQVVWPTTLTKLRSLVLEAGIFPHPYSDECGFSLEKLNIPGLASVATRLVSLTLDDFQCDRCEGLDLPDFSMLTSLREFYWRPSELLELSHHQHESGLPHDLTKYVFEDHPMQQRPPVLRLLKTLVVDTDTVQEDSSYLRKLAAASRFRLRCLILNRSWNWVDTKVDSDAVLKKKREHDTDDTIPMEPAHWQYKFLLVLKDTGCLEELTHVSIDLCGVTKFQLETVRLLTSCPLLAQIIIIGCDEGMQQTLRDEFIHQGTIRPSIKIEFLEEGQLEMLPWNPGKAEESEEIVVFHPSEDLDGPSITLPGW